MPAIYFHYVRAISQRRNIKGHALCARTTVCEATSEPSVVKRRTRTELAEDGTPLMPTLSVPSRIRVCADGNGRSRGGDDDDDDEDDELVGVAFVGGA